MCCESEEADCKPVPESVGGGGGGKEQTTPESEKKNVTSRQVARERAIHQQLKLTPSPPTGILGLVDHFSICSTVPGLSFSVLNS